MQVSNYLLHQSSINWTSALQPWGWLLPERFTLWLVNRFGDCFIVGEDDSVSMFDVGIGTLDIVAKSKAHFAELSDIDDNFAGWFLTDLVDQLVAAGLTLKLGQCYSFKVPPVLGGKYVVDNVFVHSIEKHLAAYADIHRQLEGLPDGTQINLKIKW